MRSVKEVLSKMKSVKTGQVVRDWRQLLPPGSRWDPGDPGDPACKMCAGTGYVRLELPVNHPDFGTIFLCDCVNLTKYGKAA